MELDLSDLRLPARQKTVIGLAILAAMLIFGFIGYRFTTVDGEGIPQVLSWPDWRLLRAERAYQAELSRWTTSTALCSFPSLCRWCGRRKTHILTKPHGRISTGINLKPVTALAFPK